MIRHGQRTVGLIERVGVPEYGNRLAEEIIPVLRATLDIDRVYSARECSDGTFSYFQGHGIYTLYTVRGRVRLRISERRGQFLAQCMIQGQFF